MLGTPRIASLSLMLAGLVGCAAPPTPVEPEVSLSVSAVRQGPDAVEVQMTIADAGNVLAAPRVLAKIGEDASVQIAGGDPEIEIQVTSRSEGRLVDVQVAATIRYADGRTMTPIARLNASWGLQSSVSR